MTAAGLASCGSPASDVKAESSPGGNQSGGGGGTGGDSPTIEAAEPAQPTAVDIRTVDLANTTWLHSRGGFAAPGEIALVDGAAVVDEGGFPVNYTLGEVTYGDMDAGGDGAVTVTEYLRVPGQDGSVPCSDPGTGLKPRTVTIHAEGNEAWPVQTAPVAAWGGLCRTQISRHFAKNREFMGGTFSGF